MLRGIFKDWRRHGRCHHSHSRQQQVNAAFSGAAAVVVDIVCVKVAAEVRRVGHHGVADKHEGSADADGVQHEEDAQRIPTADSQVLVQTIQRLATHYVRWVVICGRIHELAYSFFSV